MVNDNLYNSVDLEITVRKSIIFYEYRELFDDHNDKPQAQDRRTLQKVLTFLPIVNDVRFSFDQGVFEYTPEIGIFGKGYDHVRQHTRHFLDAWSHEYREAWKVYNNRLDEHEEIKNYKKVMRGALQGVAAGILVGAGIDAYTTFTESTGIGWELAARSLPALLETTEIARPFIKKVGSDEKFTSTEVWALTQLIGPIIGAGMLVTGEFTGWNSSPAYKGAAVVTLNTGNNVIGAMGAYIKMFKDIREETKRKQTKYEAEHQKLWPFEWWFTDLKEDLYLAACNFWADSFQSSNAQVAATWYGTEQVLRYHGLAAESVDFGVGFGGKTLAAVESGLLSCDTAGAAYLAVHKESKRLKREIEHLTSNQHLAQLYNDTKPTPPDAARIVA
jgi:hypothetical protein